MEYIIYNVNRKIQSNVKAFGLEGFFIFLLMGILVLSFILLIILNTFLNVILATFISIALFVIAGGIATYISQKIGIRGLVKRIGSLRQVRQIFCKRYTFNTRLHEDWTLGY